MGCGYAWEGMQMKAESLIPASWFYMNETQKVKLNWFFYEYALKLFDHIEAGHKGALMRWKSRRSDEQIAEFCAYYSKRMKAGVLDQTGRNADELAVYDEYISDYCHGNKRSENKAISEVAVAAWKDLLDSCSVCSCQCLRDRFMYCEFFDRMERGGYLS